MSARAAVLRSVCPATASSLTRATAGYAASNAVDVYNGATGAWSTAQLSSQHCNLAAASVGNVALFAGGMGRGGGCLIVACVLSFDACCSIVVLFALRSLPLSCAPLQIVVFPILLKCTTAQQGHGRRLSSAWRATLSQLHLSGTWLCSLGVPHIVRYCAGSGRIVVVYCCVRVECLCVLQHCGSGGPAPASFPLSCAPLQVVLLPILWMCTTVQQGHGRLLSSARRALITQLHLSGTWLCSLGVQQQVRCCEGRERGGCVYGCLHVECLRVLQYCSSVRPATVSSLTRVTAGDLSNVVDVFNGETGEWSTAQHSVARQYPAAASVGNLALFAGGYGRGALLCREGGGGVFMVAFLLSV